MWEVLSQENPISTSLRSYPNPGLILHTNAVEAVVFPLPLTTLLFTYFLEKPLQLVYLYVFKVTFNSKWIKFNT